MSSPKTHSADTIWPALWVLLAGVSAALHAGKTAPALPALQRALGVSLLESGFLLSLVQLAGMTCGLAVGLLADGMGLRRCMMTGLGLLVLASIAGAASQSATSLLVLRGVEGFGFLLVAIPAPSLVRQLVAPSQLSRMLGLWGTYMPLGASLAMLLGPLWIGYWHWQAWWWLLAAVSAIMWGVLWFAVPSDSTRGVVAPAAQVTWLLRLRQTLRSPGPWLVALCFAMYSGQWLAVVGFLPSIYAQAGIPAALSGLLTALAAGANMLGNAGSGWLLGRGWRPHRLLMLGYSAMAVGAVVAFASFGLSEPAGVPPWVRYVAVLVFSAVGGVIPGTLFSLAVRFAPNESTVSTTVGWMQQLSALGQFAGPPLVAWVATQTGDWRSTWWVTCTCCVVGLALAWRVGGLLRRQGSR